MVTILTAVGWFWIVASPRPGLDAVSASHRALAPLCPRTPSSVHCSHMQNVDLPSQTKMLQIYQYKCVCVCVSLYVCL